MFPARGVVCAHGTGMLCQFFTREGHSRGLDTRVNTGVGDTHSAVIQRGHVLVGPQRQLWPLSVVQPPADVVQMLEVERRD